MNASRTLAAALAAILAGGLSVAPLAAQEVPAMPAPVPVALTGATTALLVLDVIDPICNPNPTCAAFVPRLAALIANARRAGVLIAYSAAEPRGMTVPFAMPPFVAAVAPAAGDPVVLGNGQDRFYATRLDDTLRKRGITTLVLAGWRENGSVVYTAIGASLRGYTTVVADDVVSAATPLDIAIGRYQLLTQLAGNPKNEPLLKGAVTLSRSDLITLR